MHNHRIYLIGFMGSGKSSTGRALARHLDLPFLDLDEVIERACGLTIPQLFARRGEDSFRRLEAKVLRSTVDYPEAVIACGGGTPCQHGNLEWMNKHGLTVYLNSPVEVLLERLEHAAEERPLLKDKTPEEREAFIRQKLTERLPYYEKASVLFETSDYGEAAAAALADNLQQVVGH